MGFSEEKIFKPADMGNLDLLDIHCSICKDILEDPLMVPGCEHTHCRNCVQGAMHADEEGQRCPTCRTFVPSVESLDPAPRVLRNILDKLRVKCCFSEEDGGGCTEPPMPLSAVRDHEKTCKHNFANISVPCDKGCGLHISAASKEGHDCVASLLQELSLLRIGMSNLTNNRRTVRIKKVAMMPPEAYQKSETFAAVGHYWNLGYSRYDQTASGDTKLFALYLTCKGPIGAEHSDHWTVRLDSVVELRLKSVTQSWWRRNGDLVDRFKTGAILSSNQPSWGYDLFIEWHKLIRPGRFVAPDGSITVEVFFPANFQIVST